ncbi:MAG: glucose-6-phosphate isomerase [Chromatiales bacterium]|nr:glucose-6-phosphate isomerase [Chromatiales bacterium]
MTPDLTTLAANSARLPTCPSWSALQQHAARLSRIPLTSLLDQPGRFETCSREADPLLLDFSRQRVTPEVLAALAELARERELPAWIELLFSGARVNQTEGRAALHMALRDPSTTPLRVEGEDVREAVRAEREKMLALARSLREGRLEGATGQPLTQIVNIGIGGSDLGPVMASQALANWRLPGMDLHFVSNIDGGELGLLLERLDPARTLFIICSKSFTTQETQLNAAAARRWLAECLGETAVARHFVAVSVNAAAMDEFGIAPEARFRLWDWVGGRYSMWSPIGLSLAIGLGEEAFGDLLAGANEMDVHFRSAPLADNLPVLLGLLGVWNQNHLGTTSHVVLPYDGRLARFPAYLQQLEMESNGKGVTRDGQPLDWTSGTVLWGEAGSNSQHSFFQLLHQGTSRFSLDFIAPVESSSPFPDQHRAGLANMLAQAETFARGFSDEEMDAGIDPALVPHKRHPGGHPSSILLLQRLDPRSLGALVALYEHKVFVQSVIWGINPFDQWGVERGKQLARTMAAALDPDHEVPADAPPIVRRLRL